MDTALHPVTRRPETTLHVLSSTPSPTPQALAAVAVFRLSEAGRKASLLAGGDGRERQQVPVEVPIARLHLVHVDTEGRARLKLQPRYEVREHQRVVRIDAAPIYDVPPTIDALFQDAARNHELESVYHGQRAAVRAVRQDADDAWRLEVAQAFLSDATRRAIVHPSPTRRRCEIATDRGRVRFDATRDRGIAKDVPAEAFRRFQADLRARRSDAQRARAAHLEVHAQKRQVVGEWMAAHGTPDQRARVAAGVLPLDEGIEAMAADAFQAVAHLPRYEHDGVERLQAHLRAHPEYAAAVVSPSSLVVSSRTLPEATASQWAAVQQVQAAVPGARVLLRERMLAWAADPKAPKLRTVTIVALQKAGPVTLRREFIVPDAAPLR
jgi:hypothetical protein